MRAIWGLIIERSINTSGDTAAGMTWLRRLDAQTRAYALNPAILDAKLARREGLVTLWDLPDILISRAKGMPFSYVFPSSGTVVIEDAIGLVRGSRHPDAAKRSLISSVAPKPRCLRRTRCSAFPRAPTSSVTRFPHGSRP